MTTQSDTLNAELYARVMAVLDEGHQRVRAILLADGRKFWLKRIESLPLRLRLQKGDARAAFEAERAGLRMLQDSGMPVAAIALDGPDFIVLPDVGRTLDLVLRHGPEADRLAAFTAAGRSLARLHRAGFVHGRPAIRDICWDGREARFIDLERFSSTRHGTLHQALDVVMLVQTFMTAGGPAPALDAALQSYAETAPPDVLPMAARVVRWLAWLGPLTRGIARHRPRSRELAAVSQTLARLR